MLLLFKSIFLANHLIVFIFQNIKNDFVKGLNIECSQNELGWFELEAAAAGLCKQENQSFTYI